MVICTNQADKGDEIRRKGEEGRDRMREKALVIAHEIVRKIELSYKVQLSREDFDFVIEKTREAAVEGYLVVFEGILLIARPLR